MKRPLRSWLWRVPIDREVDDEIAFHIEMRTRELVDKGLDPRIAREMVLARLGDAARLKRTCVDLGRKREREMRVTQWLEEFTDDVQEIVGVEPADESAAGLASAVRLAMARLRCWR